MEKEVLALDSTQISSWLECHRQWKLGYDEHLIPITEAKAFGYGKLIHQMMEVYYRLLKLGVFPDKASNETLLVIKNWISTGEVKTSIKEFEPFASILNGQWKEDFKRLVKLDNESWKLLSSRFLQYTLTYRDDKFKVVDVEVGFSVPLLETTTQYYVLEGRIDLLLKSPEGETYWVDHKSQSREYKYYQNSVQFLNYSIALGAKHGMINYFGLQKTEPKNGFFFRQPFKFSPKILAEWKMELFTIFSEISKCKRTQSFRKNRHSCKNGLNGICPYTHICEQTIPAFESEIKRTEFQIRDPWSPWRTGEENGE